MSPLISIIRNRDQGGTEDLFVHLFSSHSKSKGASLSLGSLYILLSVTSRSFLVAGVSLSGVEWEGETQSRTGLGLTPQED